jgi:hypothetical protein
MATPPNGTGTVPPRRVVLLGASNLTKAVSTVVETACRVWGRPLDVLAALGHGRSYGLRRAYFFRELPGMRGCGLWEALERRPPAETAALVTDIGNDLLYEVPVSDIAEWVEACVDRLQRAGARVAMTPLPLCNLAALSPARFTLLRTVFFPRCRLRLADVAERSHDLDARLRALARRRQLLLAEYRPEWYGFDPIHVRMRCRPLAWRQILSAWSGAAPLPDPAPPLPGRWLYLRSLVPERRWLLGWEQRQTQPAGALPDGTTVAFY